MGGSAGTELRVVRSSSLMSLPFISASAVGGLGLCFACPSLVGGMLIRVSGLLLLLSLLVLR